MNIRIKKRGGEITEKTVTFTKFKDDNYFVKTSYAVKVGDTQIGTVRRADGQIKKFRRNLLDGTETVDRWFARTAAGKELGQKSPYDEGFATRIEAATELLEEVLKIRREY